MTSERGALITDYIAAGFALVLIPHGKKGPIDKGWNLPENCIRTPAEAARLNGSSNIGVAHAYCEPTPTCAVDVDDIELARPWLKERGVDLDALLADPDAVRIHSDRTGKAKLLYRLQQPLPSCVVAGGGLELRCASKEGRTVQDVLPPSIHPDTGKPYRLTGDIAAIPTIPDALLKVWRQALADSQGDRAQVDLAPVDETALAARLQAVQIDPELAKLQRGEALPWMKDTSRSGFDFALAFVLARLGFTGGEIAALLLRYPHGKAAERPNAKQYIGGILKEVHARTAAVAAPAGFPTARHLTTDQANASRLYQAAGSNIMFSAGQWFTWGGTYWGASEAAAYRQTCNLSALILDEAAEWEHRPAGSTEESEKNNGIAEALRKWGKQSEMKPRLDAAFQLLRRLVEVPAETLDADPYLLNVANGTVDLRTGRLRQHDKADRITRIVPIAFHSESKAPLFKKALAEITGEDGRERKPIAEFHQRWFGYCATGLVSEQKFAVHHGGGENGKSLLLGTIERVLGPYAMPAAPSLLVGNAHDRHPTEVADLRGKRMVTAYESSEDGVLREEFIKRATGGDRIKARFMRQDFFTFDPTHKLQLVTNHKPQIRGQDHAVWRRVLLVPYIIRFGTREDVDKGDAHHIKNTGLDEALKAEDEGILAWIVTGAAKWHMLGLNPPDTVLAAGTAYREEQDRVGQFIQECCERQTGTKVPLAALYPAYMRWAKECGFIALGRNKFAEAVESRPGISAREEPYKEYGRAHKGKVFSGLKMVSIC